MANLTESRRDGTPFGGMWSFSLAFNAAATILLVSSVGYFFTKLYEARMRVRDKQKKGLVSPSIVHSTDIVF